MNYFHISCIIVIYDQEGIKLKKTLLVLLLSFVLILSACGSDKPEKKEEPVTEEVTKEPVVYEEPEEDEQELSPVEEAEYNANEHPASPGKKLFDGEFKGMQYHFKGELIKTEQVEGLFGEMEEAFLVKNEKGFVIVIFPNYPIEVSVGDTIEAWGPLSGDGYSSSDLNVENVVGVTGAINASIIEVNGELK